LKPQRLSWYRSKIKYGVRVKYSVLADVYGNLEKNPSHLKKTEILADLLKKIPEKDLEMVVLLITGNVFPSWSDEELGVARQLVIKSVSKAYGINEEDIVKTFNKTGDLGLTVEEYSKKKKQTTLARRELTIDKVFENLRRIAKEAGKGSQERKMNLVAELISKAKPKEARYIIRTVLWQLRVGVARGIVRDSIARAFDVSPKVVERAWFLNQDFGYLAKIAKEKGEEGLKKIKMSIGKPSSVQLAEKSPSLQDALDSYDKVALEFKYDGMRAQIHKDKDNYMLWIYTRRLENVTKAFPDLVEMCKKYIKCDKCIVEGEILAIDPKTGKPLPFQRLSQRIKRKYDIEETIKEIPVKINFFDIVYFKGESLFDKSLEERRNILEKIIKVVPGKVELAEQLITKDFKKADRFYKKALKEGQEGLVVKNLEANYQPGRRVVGGWLKVKPILETLDLAIIGAIWGTGKRTGWLGSYILGCKDSKTGKFLECGMMGTGIKEKKTEKEDITFNYLTKMLKPLITKETGNKVDIKPKVVVEVAYEEIQKSPTYSSGFALRFPRLVRVRFDKGPEQADDTKRIEKIFKAQKGRK